MCLHFFCITASYTDHLMKCDGLNHSLWPALFLFCRTQTLHTVLSVPSVRMLYTQQQQPKNTDVIGATMCVFNKKISPKCSLCKSQRSKSVQIKTSKRQPVSSCYDLGYIRSSIFQTSCLRKIFVKCFVNFVCANLKKGLGTCTNCAFGGFSKWNTDLERLATEALRNFLLGDKSLGQSAGIIYMLLHLTTWKT